MKIAIIGSGYVGLVTGGCLANLGNDVVCVDIDEERIADLRKGKLPFFEPGLRDIVELNLKQRRLMFTTDTALAVENTDVIFIAVGTPTGSDGGADLSGVFAVAEDIGKSMRDPRIVVMKSTVPIGTVHNVAEVIKKNQQYPVDFDMASNPEFLREGEAVNDFMTPDRIVIGAESDKARDTMTAIYRPIERAGRPILVTTILNAELIKYASNAMLATRISFMNELAQLCESENADIKVIAKGIGLDTRIGTRFLQAGAGYGGSCFPKDVKALIRTLEDKGHNASLLSAVEFVNERQKSSVVPKLQKFMPNLEGKRIALWGLAFKPKTDDMREAASLVIARQLIDEGAHVVAYDPVAMDVARKIIPDISFADSPFDAIEGADALIVATEWDAFRELDKKKMHDLMRSPVVIDGRNIYEPGEMAELGFQYVGMGR